MRIITHSLKKVTARITAVFAFILSWHSLPAADIIAAADTVSEIEIEEEALMADALSPAEKYYQDLGRSHPVDDALESGDYQAMSDSASLVLAKFPDDYYSLRTRSYARYMLEDYAGSLGDALEILCFSEDDPLIIGIVQNIVNSEPALAKSLISPYVEPYMESPDPEQGACARLYLNHLGRSLINLADMKEAYRVAMLAVDIPNFDIDSELLLATVFMRTGNPAEAEKVLRPLVQDLDNVDPTALFNYLLTLRNAGHSKEALKIYDKMLSKDLDYDFHIQLLFNKAVLLAANGQYESALDLFDNVLDSLTPDAEDDEISPLVPEILLREGIIDIISGERAQGEDEIRRALSFMGDEDNPTGMEATAYAWLGDRENTWKWRDIYGADNTYDTTLHAILGDYDKALELLSEDFKNFVITPMQIAYDLNFYGLRQTPGYRQLAESYTPLPLP